VEAKEMKLRIATSLFLVLFAACVFGQAKKATKTPAQVLDAPRVWHHETVKDELDGDQVVYYLPTVEDKNVWLIVACPGAKAGFASLQFRFPLYGGHTATLKYKSSDGKTQELNLGLSDSGDVLVASRADVFKPLVGGTF
jgi:hypothetical protein